MFKYLILTSIFIIMLIDGFELMMNLIMTNLNWIWYDDEFDDEFELNLNWIWIDDEFELMKFLTF